MFPLRDRYMVYMYRPKNINFPPNLSRLPAPSIPAPRPLYPRFRPSTPDYAPSNPDSAPVIPVPPAPMSTRDGVIVICNQRTIF